MMDFKEQTHINYRHLIQKHTGEGEKRQTQRRVEAFFDAFTKLYKEKQGGVFLEDFGYFCHIKSPKRIYNYRGLLYRPYFPYLFTELNTVKGAIKNWTMEGLFKKEFKPKKPYTLHYTMIKKYANKK